MLIIRIRALLIGSAGCHLEAIFVPESIMYPCIGTKKRPQAKLCTTLATGQAKNGT